jgi:ketosteroid isomerase-like protein
MNAHTPRTLTILTIAICLLTSCTAASTESPAAFANRFIEAENKAWRDGDLADLKAIEADDVIYHLPEMDLKGWSAHESYIQQGRAAVSNMKQSWKYLTGEGNHFVLSYESSADLRPDPTKPATPVTLNYLCAFRVKDGKIAEVWMNGTTATAPVADAAKK